MVGLTSFDRAGGRVVVVPYRRFVLVGAWPQERALGDGKLAGLAAFDHRT